MTAMDYLYLFGLLCVAGWCSYATHEVSNAIHSYLNDWKDV